MGVQLDLQHPRVMLGDAEEQGDTANLIGAPPRMINYSLGLDEVKKPKSLVKALIAEMLGTAFIVIIGCGSAINYRAPVPQDWTQISLAFGLVVATVVTITGPISGAHLNPAVTAGLLVGGEVSLIRSLFYVVFQCLGGILGAAILYGITPAAKRGPLGANGVNFAAGVGVGEAILLEALLTMILVLIVYTSAVDANTSGAKGTAPLMIGLWVAAACLMGIPYTGTSINPARSLGPPLVMGNYDRYQLVFWAGPMLGGILGGMLYTRVLRQEGELVSKGIDEEDLSGSVRKMSRPE